MITTETDLLSLIGNILIVIGYISIAIQLFSLLKFSREIEGGFAIVKLFITFLISASIGRAFRVYQIFFLGIKTFLPFTIFDVVTGFVSIITAIALSSFLKKLRIKSFKQLENKIDELREEQKISQIKLDDTKKELREVIRISKEK